MSEALVRLLLLSLAGSLLALLLYLLQPLLKRMVTRRILYVLWVIVMVRMVVPVGVASIGTGALIPAPSPTPSITQPAVTRAPTTPVSTKAPTPTQPIATVTAAPTKTAATPTPAGSGIIGGGTATGGGRIAVLFTSVSEAVDRIVRSVRDSVTPLSAVLLGAWLLGALTSLSGVSVRHRRILREILREAHPASTEDVALLDACRTEFGIRQPVEMVRAASVPTPILSGIRRPLLCLPEREFMAEELKLVLQHEMMHLKHHDLLVKRIAHWVCAIHWFNPSVYLIRHELSQAAELACDESVSARLEKADRKRYGEVLLQQAAQRPYSPYSGTQALSESGRRLRQRLRVIAQMQAAPRRKRVAGLAALLLLLVMPLPQFAPIALTGCAAVTPTATVAPNPSPTPVEEPSPTVTFVSSPTPAATQSTAIVHSIEYLDIHGVTQTVSITTSGEPGSESIVAHSEEISRLHATYDPDLFILEFNETLMAYLLDRKTWTLRYFIAQWDGHALEDVVEGGMKNQKDGYSLYLASDLLMAPDGSGFVYYTNWKTAFEDTMTASRGQQRYFDLKTGSDTLVLEGGFQIGWSSDGRFYLYDYACILFGFEPVSFTTTRLVSIGTELFVSTRILGDTLLFGRSEGGIARLDLGTLVVETIPTLKDYPYKDIDFGFSDPLMPDSALFRIELPGYPAKRLCLIRDEGRFVCFYDPPTGKEISTYAFKTPDTLLIGLEEKVDPSAKSKIEVSIQSMKTS
jgi:beta-lactamase regulating signal transducer with metallopeptidase domain